MVIVTSGKNWKGEDCEFYMDGYLLKNVEKVKEVVQKKDFDYVAIIAGLPGAGKSNFAITLAKYFCPWFDHTYIAYTAEQFIELTNNCPKRSSVVLDESFASLNSKVGMSSDYLKVVNHLQLIRQKNLFILLCLPNFFDLNKGIAIYRTSHLFVIYGKKFGDRGSFSAFDRDNKKMLYIKGQKYMNYNCVKPNFRGQFTKQKALPVEIYDKLKLQHLKEQNINIGRKTTRVNVQRDKVLAYCKFILKIPVKKLQDLTKLTPESIYTAIRQEKDNILNEYSGDIKES